MAICWIFACIVLVESLNVGLINVFFASIALVDGFNVDVRRPIVLKKPQSQNETYFGYSSLLQKKSAYIGAPVNKVHISSIVY
jgi:hypothetical protein